MSNKPAYHNLYYSSRWKRLRADQLAKSPLCAYCQADGIITAAAIADHIAPHKGALDLFFNPDNLQSLCKRCHDSHKQRQEKSGIIAGHSADGAPLDPLSHWFK